ncbi:MULTISPECIES: dCTP deaminase domain-containing protein [Metallosphaera]|uniref:dCTP deaminase n=1 Tax=Metallosphaera TaxID=41980 RepID=UPI001F054DA0|nr:deoxycytidine triphosphate deaminase [Metallosphaera sedula]MCH1770229.1 deoxycytidine triphosphate deaminase [Metallosphaera sedula]MCP6727937.1 deoxycytidine triphosphate deaminase [Metallosphaera sedula]
MIYAHQSIVKSLGNMILNYSMENVKENGYDLRICGEKYWRVKGDSQLPEVKSELEELSFSEYATLEPGNTYLFESCEEVNMPADTIAIMTLRSTLARNGFIAPPTVIDAGYHGKIIISISTLRGGKLKKGMGVIHLIFSRLDSPTEKVYQGKYQGGRLI